MFNKVILIGRLGQNAEAKIAQNNQRVRRPQHRNSGKLAQRQGRLRDPHRMASRLCLEGFSKFARTLQKGQLVTLEGTLRYREVETEGQPKQRTGRNPRHEHEAALEARGHR